MEENKDNSDDEIIGHRIRKKIKTSPKHTIDPKEFFQSNIQNQNDLVSQNVIPAENNNNLLYPNPLQIDHPINFQTQEKDAPGFYEDKPMISKIERNSYLETSDLRNFHNWIKSVMIKIYSEKLQTLLKQKKCDGKLSVLEIGCGQGGDLTKWAHSSIGSFIGIDVAANYLERAKERYANLVKDRRFPNIYKAQFYVMNGEAEENIFFSNFSEKLYFDLISCQFSLHYMFYSKESVQNLFRNLTYKLVNQGYVIMTIPDANVIVKRFRKNGKQFGVGGDFVVGNKFYSMKIDTLDFPKDKVYGLKYFFYLEDAVGDKKQLSDDDPIITYVPEYLIEFQNFVKTAENFGLELIEQKNFLDFYKDNRDEHKNLFSVLKLKYEENKSMNKNLWEISHLYKTVVFKKIRGKSMDEIERSFKDIKQSYYEIKMEEKFR